MEKKNNNEEYKWFESDNPLKHQPFPWMKQQNDKKKKPRYRLRKEDE